MKARIRFGVRGLDAKVIDEDLTLTKNWTTVTESQAEELVGLLYKDKPFVEFDEVAADEAATERPGWFVETVDTEDESDGTE